MSESGEIFRGQSEKNLDWKLPPAPPWREFRKGRADRKGETYRASKKESELVNAAIHLRRPLLVTGKPGVGKTSLAYSVAWELVLGEVLSWPINTRSTLQQGLYDYDAIARVRDASLSDGSKRGEFDIGHYVKLGPLGTAFLGSDDEKPRVLLVDEIDKSDIDLPNDLLNVFEEGEFEIRELSRLPGKEAVMVATADGRQAKIRGGRVQCKTFPIVFLTSNGEREFPPAFLRRCLRLDIEPPNKEMLRQIVYQHLGESKNGGAVDALIEEFLAARDDKNKALATDQLLNAVFMLAQGGDANNRELLRDALLRPLADSQ